jgi:hypothetical protein
MEPRFWMARHYDARSFAQRVSCDSGPRRLRVDGDRSRCRAASSAEGNAGASIHGMGLGGPDDTRRRDLAFHPYDQNVGALEPNPSSVSIHIGDSPARRGVRRQARSPPSSNYYDLDLRSCLDRGRIIHSSAWAHHARRDFWKLTSRGGFRGRLARLRQHQRVSLSDSDESSSVDYLAAGAPEMNEEDERPPPTCACNTA